MNDYIEQRDESAPDGYRYATTGEHADGIATHCVCSCGKRRVVGRDESDHQCNWTWLVKTGDAGEGTE
jgi:hypothetical protein